MSDAGESWTRGWRRRGVRGIRVDRRECAERARRSRFSHSISVADFEVPIPSAAPTMESLCRAGKRISLLNVNRLETIDAFTGLSDFPLCSDRAVPRSARAIYIRGRALSRY